MQIQKSFDAQTDASLYIVPTPIGNLEDITYRALKVLRSVSVIAAEDTRNTKKLLNHFEIQVPLISYHEHNKNAREQQLLGRLEQGDSIAVVSDAGMPGISDPGYELIQAAISEDIPVVVLPGANAALCALIGSGLPSDDFYFFGFLPRKKKERETVLTRLRKVPATLLFYESPHRLKATLQSIHKQLGNRKLTVARELTKRFEEYIRGTVKEVMTWADAQELKGEFCLVLEGSTETEEAEEALWWSELTVIAHVEHYMKEEAKTSKEAIKQVALDRNMSKRDVYQTYHVR